jgi:hypothetical protein
MKTELENLRDRTLYFGSYKPENIEMATGILADDVQRGHYGACTYIVQSQDAQS